MKNMCGNNCNEEDIAKGIVKFLVDVYDEADETVDIATILTLVKSLVALSYIALSGLAHHSACFARWTSSTVDLCRPFRACSRLW